MTEQLNTKQKILNNILKNQKVVVMDNTGEYANTLSLLELNTEKPLILPIKKEWFDMILSGEKKEEYRDIKPYYDTRLQRHFECVRKGSELLSKEPEQQLSAKFITFRNGYSKKSPSLLAECALRIGTGKPEWGAEKDKLYYILEIKQVIKDMGN